MQAFLAIVNFCAAKLCPIRGEIYMSSSTRHTTAAWLLAASLIGFAALVVNGVSDANSKQNGNAISEAEDPADMPLFDDSDEQDIALGRPEEPQIAPDDSAPAE